MGKRKSRKAPRPKKREVLNKEFDCSQCSAKKAIEVRINRKLATANLICRKCGATYSRQVLPSEVEIDVVTEWLDLMRGATPLRLMTNEDQKKVSNAILQRTAPSAPIHPMSSCEKQLNEFEESIFGDMSGIEADNASEMASSCLGPDEPLNEISIEHVKPVGDTRTVTGVEIVGDDLFGDNEFDEIESDFDE